MFGPTVDWATKPTSTPLEDIRRVMEEHRANGCIRSIASYESPTLQWYKEKLWQEEGREPRVPTAPLLERVRL